MTIRGLKYKFNIINLNKYVDDVKYGRFNWPVEYRTIGKKKIKDPKERKKILVKEIHFDRLFRVLKETDWAESPLYQVFLKHGRWIHENLNIYSEVELKYLHSSLTNMVKEDKPNYQEF